MQGRPTLAAHRPQTKKPPKKRTRLPNAWAPTSPTFEERSNKNSKCPPERIKAARGSSIASSSHTHPSRHRLFMIPRGTLFSTSDIHTFRRCCLTATSRITARPIPRGHAASQPSPLQLQPAISPQLLGLEWLTKRYCRC